MTARLLFVYGTLRRDSAHEMSRFLAAHARHAGAATWQGRLYRISYYPGAVPSADTADSVHGDVYELADADEALVALDDFEGVGPGYAEPWEYERRLETLKLADGREVRGWVYVFNRPVEGLERIPSGDFLDCLGK